MTTKVHVPNEIAPLKRVIVHRPDAGIARVSPKVAEELLFDDIVYLPQMQYEHQVFTDVLKAFLGEHNVMDLEQLLAEALDNDPENKKELIDQVLDFEELPQIFKSELEQLDNQRLSEVLISGYNAYTDHIIFNPIPNLIFTRDIAVIVNDYVIITKAAKEARYRENLLTRFIFYAHPIFQELQNTNRIINLNRIDQFPPSFQGEKISIEGGDMMIINEDYLLIGCSERTTQHAIHSLKEVLFKRGIIENVVQVNIPQDRSFMHIDTIFTQISPKHVVCYKPIVIDGLGSYVEVFTKSGTTRMYHSIKDFFHGEINADIEFILSGQGISPYQEREQWTDGCNLVAIKPGVAITYDRNPYTEEAFKQAGYEIIAAEKLLALIASGDLNTQHIEKTIITLPSNELSRARGGSHCMTCPIERG